jgi:predicted small lipoprotein YifL
LAGCGRKGGLDLPPNSAPPQPSAQTTTQPTTGQARTSDADAPDNRGGGLFSSSATSDESPAAAKGRKKSFALDPLLSN